MSKFALSTRSIGRLANTDERILTLLLNAIQYTAIDFGIPKDGGLRTAERQNEIFASGASQKDGYVKISYHQTGKAFDIVCYSSGSVTWDKIYYYMVAGVILGTAKAMGINLVWGGNWDNDTDLKDQSFMDLGHFQLMD